MISFTDILEYTAFKALAIFFFFLPRPFCLSMGRLLGILAYYIDAKHRMIALSNLKTAFGQELPESRLVFISKKSFIHFGETIADILKLSHYKPEQIKKIVSTEGEEYLRKALDEGRGVIIFTAHFGNWEIGSAAVSRISTVRVIARALDNRLLERELVRIRTKFGAHVIYKQEAAKKILQSLRRHETVAILIDLNVLRSQAIFVDFFGKLAATTPALAAFSIRTEAPLVPAFCYPRPDHSYCLKIMEPVQISLAGHYDQDVLKITQICTKIIENEIRNSPCFWFWVHNRWKTRPAELKN